MKLLIYVNHFPKNALHTGSSKCCYLASTGNELLVSAQKASFITNSAVRPQVNYLISLHFYFLADTPLLFFLDISLDMVSQPPWQPGVAMCQVLAVGRKWCTPFPGLDCAEHPVHDLPCSSPWLAWCRQAYHHPWKSHFEDGRAIDRGLSPSVTTYWRATC